MEALGGTHQTFTAHPPAKPPDPGQTGPTGSPDGPYRCPIGLKSTPRPARAHAWAGLDLPAALRPPALPGQAQTALLPPGTGAPDFHCKKCMRAAWQPGRMAGRRPPARCGRAGRGRSGPPVAAAMACACPAPTGRKVGCRPAQTLCGCHRCKKTRGLAPAGLNMPAPAHGGAGWWPVVRPGSRRRNRLAWMLPG